MNLVVLDGHTLNPGDISWEPIESLGVLTVYEHSSPQEVLQRSEGAHALLTNKTVLNGELLQQLPALRYIGVLATGHNVVDIRAALELGIVVTNVPGYSTCSVAQFVFAQILNWAQPVSYYNNSVKAGRWSQSRDFCYYDHSMLELNGLTLGLIGYGAIGQQVATIAGVFGMKVLINCRTAMHDLPDGTTQCELDELVTKSDIVSLHCPLTENNEKMVDKRFLEKMKNSALLVNTSRGPLIDEAALYRALANKKIAAAALDVLSEEPPPQSNPLLALDNCFITPHIAWATQASRTRLMNIAAENLRRFMMSNPVNNITA